MKSLLALILIAGFMGVAVFGAFSMNHGVMHEDGCVAAAVQGTDCPKEENVLSFVNFHLDALKGFSAAAFGETVLVSLLSLIAIAAAAGFGVTLGNPFLPQPDFAYSRFKRKEFFNSPPKRELTRWLSLRENSPAVF